MAEEENLRSAILVQDEIAERANSTASSTISPDTPMWFIGSNMASSSSAENAAAISGVLLHTSISSIFLSPPQRMLNEVFHELHP